MMKFNFRKIASGAASAAMIGSTVALAAAANFPAPFVNGGVGDVAVVYGSNLDLAAVSDITSALNAQITSTGSTGITGDFVQLDKSSDHVNLGDAINGPFGSTVDSDDLVLLADGVYVADDSDTFDYEQKILLGSPELAHFQDSDYEDLIGTGDRTPTVGVNITSAQFVMNYTLDFLDDAESDIVGTTSGGDLDDLEGSFLPMFGKEFYVSDWKNGTSTELGTGKLTLLDAAVKGTVKEGDVLTLSLNGKTYEVSIDYIDADSTVLSINGEFTDDLLKGETEKLADGTYVGITSVRRLAVSGELGSVEFSLGNGKLELEHKTDIKLNDESITDIKAYLYHSSASTNVDKIAIEWKAEDDLFITPETEVPMPGFGGLKFSMTEFVRGSEGEESISVKHAGKDKIELKVPIKDGDATIGLLYENTTAGWIGIGEEANKRLATSPQTDMMFWDKKNGNKHHAYFVATYASTKDAQSYLLDFNVRTDGTRKEVDVINKVTGVTEVSDKTDGDTVTIGDVQFTINNITQNSQNESVNISAGTNINFNTVYTPGGLRMYLPFSVGGTDPLVTDSQACENGAQHNVYCGGGYTYGTAGVLNLTGDGSDDTAASAGHNNATFYLFIDGEDKDDTLGAGTGFEFRLSSDLGSGNEVEVDQINSTGTYAGTGGVQGKESEAIGENVYEAYIYDDVGPRILHYTDGDQDYVELYYPGGDSESYAKIFLSSTGSTTSGGVAGGLSVMDSELASSGMQTKNLILVGGTCVNSATATALGLADPTCGNGWTAATGSGAGSWIIQSMANPWSSAKIATVVAGYEQGDTVNAAEAFTTQEIDTSAGKKYTGTTGTAATPVIV